MFKLKDKFDQKSKLFCKKKKFIKKLTVVVEPEHPSFAVSLYFHVIVCIRCWKYTK